MTDYTLYSMQDSGNRYKVRLLLRLLGLPFRLIDTDSRDGSTRKPEFLAINPNGKVPLLVLTDGRLLSESNAISSSAGARSEIYADRIPEFSRRSYQALDVMETRLGKADWLAGRIFSVADIALYAYTHLAHQSGFDLARYPGISAWLDRIAARPGHIDIDWRPS